MCTTYLSKAWSLLQIVNRQGKEKEKVEMPELQVIIMVFTAKAEYSLITFHLFFIQPLSVLCGVLQALLRFLSLFIHLWKQI